MFAYTLLRFIYSYARVLWRSYQPALLAAKSYNIVKIKYKSKLVCLAQRQEQKGDVHLRHRGLKSDLSHIPCRDVSVEEKGEERNATRIPPVSYLKFTSNYTRFNPGNAVPLERTLHPREPITYLAT